MVSFRSIPKVLSTWWFYYGGASFYNPIMSNWFWTSSTFSVFWAEIVWFSCLTGRWLNISSIPVFCWSGASFLAGASFPNMSSKVEDAAGTCCRTSCFTSFGGSLLNISNASYTGGWDTGGACTGAATGCCFYTGAWFYLGYAGAGLYLISSLCWFLF